MRKAVVFFSVVFFSMLAVFLVATGEVSRWLSEEGPPGTVRVRTTMESGYEQEGDGNLFKFDYYDPERGRRNFTIVAEFSQENLHGSSRIEELKEIRLSNGRIEIPLRSGLRLPARDAGSEDASAGAAPDDSPGSGRIESFVIRFRSALFQRQGTSGHRFVLEDGSGHADDGTEMLFEGMIVESRPSEEGGGYTLTSAKPAAIKNSFLYLSSPQGFAGTLSNGGLESLHFLPPVTTLLNAGGAGLLPGEVSAGSSGASDRLAITSKGPLELTFDAAQTRDRDGDREAPTRTLILFQEDVVVYPVEATVDTANLPSAVDRNRVECQRLLAELSSASGPAGENRLVPRRMTMTREGGRVRAYFFQGPKEYVVEGDRLEWVHPGGADFSREALTQGEATLYGRPTVRRVDGSDLRFESERAVIRPAKDSMFFENVRGVFDFSDSRREEARPGKSGGGPRGAADSPRTAFGDPPTADSRRGSSARMPRLWDARADEVEFHFGRTAAGRQELSAILARSHEPDGVVIESRPGSDTAANRKVLRVTASRLKYDEGARTMALSGVPSANPRLVLGENRIDARAIELDPQRGEATFVGEAHARVVDFEALTKVSDGRGDLEEQESSAEGIGSRKSASSLPTAYDLRAERLVVGFLKARGGDGSGEFSLLFLHAESPGNSSDDTEARVIVESLADPWFRFAGREIYWDHIDRKAWFYGAVRKAAMNGNSAAATGDDRRAQFFFEGGVLEAHEIRFDEQRWTAFLSDEVFIKATGVGRPDDSRGRGRVSPAREPLTMRTGLARVEFFEGFKAGPGPQDGLFEQLRMVKQLHATRSAERPIELRGAGCIGRAEELAWDAESRELRFFGRARQEIEVLRDDYMGPLSAREVLYREQTEQIILVGDVRGEFTQVPPSSDGPILDSRPTPAAHEDEKDDRLVWHLETERLEIQTRRRADKGTALELVSMRARDRVRVEERSHGLMFQGDELFYEHDERKMRIFSPDDGRPQTLFRYRVDGQAARDGGQTGESAAGRPRGEAADKILAQEIWLALRPKGPGAEPDENWLLIDFEQDVIASFNPGSSELETKLEELSERWKMRADRLTVCVDPHEKQDTARMFPWVRASGKVNFYSGKYEAFAESALYAEADKELTLSGSRNAPPRLLYNTKLISDGAKNQIRLRKEGTAWSFRESRRGR